MLFRVAEFTVSGAVLLKPPNVAVIVTGVAGGVGLMPIAPPWLTVACEGALETHNALEETSCVGVAGVVIVKVAVAVNCCEPPTGMVAAIGVTVMELAIALVTVKSTF